MGFGQKIRLLPLFLVIAVTASGQNGNLGATLNESVISVSRYSVPVKGNVIRYMALDSLSVKAFPRFLGDMNPIRAFQSMPGVQTTSLSLNGLYVKGFKDAQNLYLMNGAPLYAAPRLFGLFPFVNQAHFQNTTLQSDAPASVLGGMVTYETGSDIVRQLKGDCSVGLLSARTTVSVPVSERMAAKFSLRQSFLNQVYKGLLSFEGNPFEYSFTDADATLLWTGGRNSKFDVNLFFTRDVADMGYSRFNMHMDETWYSGLSSFRWKYDGGRLKSSLVVYAGSNVKQLQLERDEKRTVMPGDIHEYGLRSSISTVGGFTFEANVLMRSIQPQEHRSGSSPASRSDGLLLRSYQAEGAVNRIFSVGMLSLMPAVRFIMYRGDDVRFDVDPQLELACDSGRGGRTVLYVGRRHQYYHLGEIINNTFPVSLWVPAGNLVPAQESVSATLSHELQISGGKWGLSAQLYGARLRNQLEFNGFVLDFLKDDYDFRNYIYALSGYNYGFSLMARKNYGRLTGWASYNFGRSIRNGGDIVPYDFPSNHERPHEFKMNLSFSIRKLTFGAMFVVASGTPCTPVSSYYFINDSVVAEYGRINSWRLPAYMSLDVSADYDLPSHGRYTHGINLSLLNATGHNNVLLYYLDIDEENRTFRYKGGKFMIPVLPSVSYYCKF